MQDKRSTKDVFIDAVKDHLNGTPNASHPVQFIGYTDEYCVCTLCGAVVPYTDAWMNTHRKNHDDHNHVHDAIEKEARNYKSPPTYGQAF